MTTLTTGPHADRRERSSVRCRMLPAGGRPCLGAGGFTLLELVLVMVIICTVLAMAAPSLRGFFASRKTHDAAAQIVALTQLARSQAVSEGRVYRLNFDVEAGSYWLTAQHQGVFEDLGSEFGRLFLLPAGTVIELTAEGDPARLEYIRFYPNGRTEAATIRLTGQQGEVIEVESLSPTESFRVTVPEELQYE